MSPPSASARAEVKRDLETLKNAHSKAEHDIHDLEETLEREIRAANLEIRQLKVRLFPHVAQREDVGFPWVVTR